MLKSPLLQNFEAEYFKFTLPTKIMKVLRQLIIEQDNSLGKNGLLFEMEK